MSCMGQPDRAKHRIRLGPLQTFLPSDEFATNIFEGQKS